MTTESTHPLARFTLRFLPLLALLLATACGNTTTGDCASTTTTSTYACLDRLAQPLAAPPLGINVHYGASRGPVDREALARLRTLGASVIRNDVAWADIETTPGVYDFETTGYDAVVAAAEAEGLRVLLLLDYGNTLYGPGSAVVDDAGRAAYAAFAGAVAARYGGRGHRFEIWNEPNLRQFWRTDDSGPDPDAYARLVAAAVPAIRAADPHADVLIGAVFLGLSEVLPLIGGIPGQEFVARVLATGVGSIASGLTVHPYRAGPPESVADDVARLRATIAAAGIELPVWSGEWGYSTYDPSVPGTGLNYLPAVSLERHASWIARMVLVQRELGLGGGVVYVDRDSQNPDPGNIEDHFGLMYGDLTPKPAYSALLALHEIVGEVPLVGTLRLGAGEHALVFEGAPAGGRTFAGTSLPAAEQTAVSASAPAAEHTAVTASAPAGQRVVALWAESPAAWSISARSGAVRILARDGADVTPPELSRGEPARLALEPDEGPVYVVGDAAFAPA